MSRRCKTVHNDCHRKLIQWGLFLKLSIATCIAFLFQRSKWGKTNQKTIHKWKTNQNCYERTTKDKIHLTVSNVFCSFSGPFLQKCSVSQKKKKKSTDQSDKNGHFLITQHYGQKYMELLQEWYYSTAVQPFLYELVFCRQ